MRLSSRHHHAGVKASVVCIRCARVRALADMVADFDGPPFAAYWCATHPPANVTEAHDVYTRAGWRPGVWWSPPPQRP